MNFKVEVDREDDGRWIAEVAELPGVLVYGGSPKQAQAKAQALALRVLADRLENGEALPFESVSLPRHEPMGQRTRPARTRSTCPDRPGREAPTWRFTPRAVSARLAGLRLGLSRQGRNRPEMLSRIAKHTGLQPGDI
jgi:predicted RNase H-like HicB family nuclease